MKKNMRIAAAGFAAVLAISGAAFSGTVSYAHHGSRHAHHSAACRREECLYVAGCKLTRKDPMYEWVTGTKLTDKAEALLKEKYGCGFVCEQYLDTMFETDALYVRLRGESADHPGHKFRIAGFSDDGTEIYDNYISAAYEEELCDWLCEGLKLNKKCVPSLSVTGALTEEEAKERVFGHPDGYCGHGFELTIRTDEKNAEKLKKRSDAMIRHMEEKLGGCDFHLYICSEDYADSAVKAERRGECFYHFSCDHRGAERRLHCYCVQTDERKFMD